MINPNIEDLEMKTKPLQFVKNGEVVSLHNVSHTQTLLEELRETLDCRGTKEGCNEGDCVGKRWTGFKGKFHHNGCLLGAWSQLTLLLDNASAHQVGHLAEILWWIGVREENKTYNCTGPDELSILSPLRILADYNPARGLPGTGHKVE